ncbi:MAG TPA: hypothetical protein VHO25_21535 [Polyangiaceae bacterium]|nr:hypothetical protein [Polyangiaceae bacterium]
MPKRRKRITLLFLVSLIGGGIGGAALGRAMLTGNSATSVMGSMMMEQQAVRMVCTAKGCVPYIPASAVGKFDLCGHSMALWTTALGASTLCALLFGAGLVWLYRHKRSPAQQPLPAETSPATPSPAPAPTSAE